LAAARNFWGWWKGQIPAEEIAWTTATDVAGKGTLALIGGFAGSAVGLLLIGPAGAVIGGPAGGIFGAGTYGRLKTWAGGHVDVEVERRVRVAAQDLVAKCIRSLERKSEIIRGKSKSLGAGPAGSYARSRFDDELQFIDERTCDLAAKLDNSDISLQTLRDRVLAAVLRSNVHSSLYQKEMRQFLDAHEDLGRALVRSIRRRVKGALAWLRKDRTDPVEERRESTN
jgi:hypothetical protein